MSYVYTHMYTYMTKYVFSSVDLRYGNTIKISRLKIWYHKIFRSVDLPVLVPSDTHIPASTQMYVFIHICIYTYIFIYINMYRFYIYTYIYIYLLPAPILPNAFRYTHTSPHTHVYNIYIYIHIFVPIYICIDSICIYVYIYIYITSAHSSQCIQIHTYQPAPQIEQGPILRCKRLCVAVRSSVLCCSVLQCVAECCIHIFSRVPFCDVSTFVLQCVAVSCSELQCAAVCCSVLQCDMLQCCSVLFTSIQQTPFL